MYVNFNCIHPVCVHCSKSKLDLNYSKEIILKKFKNSVNQNIQLDFKCLECLKTTKEIVFLEKVKNVIFVY